MADNSAQNGTDTIATDEVATLNGNASSGVKVERVKVGYGDDGSYRDSSAAFPLPVATPNGSASGTITAANASPTTGSGTANSSVTLTIPDNHSSWTAIIGGTFSAGTRLAFQCSVDGTTWYYTNARRNLDTLGANEVLSVASTDVYGSAAPTGGNPSLWKGTAGGVKYIRITCIAYTASDSVTVRIDSSAGVGGTFQLGPLPAGSSVSIADSARTSFSAPMNNTSVASAVTTSVPIWEIQNPTANTTKLIRLTRLEFQITLATAGVLPTLQIIKRAVSTGGTAVAQTAVPHDSNNAAATAVVNLYTAAPTAGATVGTFRQIRTYGYATVLTATAVPTWQAFDFGVRPAQALILRPGQALSIQGAAAFGTAPTITGTVEWTEETI